MARIREEIYSIENISAGQKCQIIVPVGRTWLDVHAELTNITLAQATDIEVKLVSGQKTVTLQEFKNGNELLEFNKRYKRQTSATGLSFYFRKPELETEGQSMATALGTEGLMSVKITFKIDGAVTSPNVEAWGRKTSNRSVRAGILPYVVNHERGGSAAGGNHFDQIDKRDRIAAIHVLNDKVEALKLVMDDATVYDLPRARSDFEDGICDRTPYGSTVGMCIDFTGSGLLDEALVMQSGNYQAQQMRLTATLGASPAGTIRYLVEYLSSWDSLGGSQRAA